MRHVEIIRQKLMKNFPKSWEVFNDACAYTVEHSLSVLQLVLFEKEITASKNKCKDNQSWDLYATTLAGEYLFYLRSLGYEHFSILLHSGYGTKTSRASGVVITCFLSEATKKLYDKEIEAKSSFQKNTTSYDPPTPLVDSIRKIDIYTHEKRGQTSGEKFNF